MLPNFIGIGAQKSGTTWLYRNLSVHPGIWMPPIKEIHFFDHRRPSLLKRLISDQSHLKKGRLYLIRQLRGWPNHAALSDISWALNYCMAPRTEAWYGRLFPAIPGKIVGEISPGYAKLRGEAVARVKRIVPDAKVIYLIRNPIERAWSYAVQHFGNPKWEGRYRSVEEVPREVLMAFFHKDREGGHTDYLGALAAWGRHYGPERLFIGYFDELEMSPSALLKKVLGFLEVDSSDATIPKNVRNNPNPGHGLAIPDEFREFLAKLHMDQIVRLNAEFENQWTRNWLADAENALGPQSRRWLRRPAQRNGRTGAIGDGSA